MLNVSHYRSPGAILVGSQRFRVAFAELFLRLLAEWDAVPCLDDVYEEIVEAGFAIFQVRQPRLPFIDADTYVFREVSAVEFEM